MSLNPLEADLSRSEGARETPAQWWNWAHEHDEPYWLSGTSGPEVWKRLGVENRLTLGASVLNIGVGLGRCTRQLAARGCEVSVLDISDVALERVADVAPGYLASDLEALPSSSFDVALSHLVAQHMNDADLEAQIRHVVRALVPDGLFAIQYLRNVNDIELDQSNTYNVKSGSICRSQAAFDALAERAGGQVIATFERDSFAGGTVFMVAHISAKVDRRPSQRWLDNLIARMRGRPSREI